MIEFAEKAPKLGLVRIELLDTFPREAIKNAKLLLSQALVSHEVDRAFRQLARCPNTRRSVFRPLIGRGQDHLRTLSRL